MCPYNAISFDDVKGVSSINAAMCQGCGTCVAACPAGAISGSAFSDEQVLAQIEGLLSVAANGAPPRRSAFPEADHQGDGHGRSPEIEEAVRA
jgi:Fe-S-cluster-containing hydrogenase component 2